MNGYVTGPPTHPYPGGQLAEDLTIHTSPRYQEPGQEREGLEGPRSWWICILEHVLTRKALGQAHYSNDARDTSGLLERPSQGSM